SRRTHRIDAARRPDHLFNLARCLRNDALRLARLDYRGHRLANHRRVVGAREICRYLGTDLFFSPDYGSRALATSVEFFSSSQGNRTTLHAEVSIQSTAIVGAGGWGTALAVLWAKRGNPITLWGNNPERAARLRE